MFFAKEHKIDFKKYKNIPQIVFENFTTYEIDSRGLKNRLTGKIAKKYRDRVEMFDFFYFDYDKNSELRAKKGVKKKDIIYLYGNIVYKTKDFKFFSSKAIYNTKKKIIKSKPKFKLFTKNSEILGNSLIYYANQGKIWAKNIDATIFEKKRK